MVKDDDSFMAELTQTCPRKVYELVDGEFYDYLTEVREVATKFTIIWLQTKIQVMAVVLEKQRWYIEGKEFEKGFLFGLS